MRSRSERSSKHLWAAMTHLTPSAWQFLSKSTGGFRFLSDSIAREVCNHTNCSLFFTIYWIFFITGMTYCLIFSDINLTFNFRLQNGIEMNGGHQQIL